MIKVDCEYCNEFLGGQDNSFARRYGPSETRTLLDTGTVRVFPTLGQIAEGHLLVAPTEHYTALADLSPSIVQTITLLAKRLRTILEHEYGPCVFFEHGARGENAGGCGIYHAHLHALPFRAQEPIAYLKSRHPYLRIGSLMELGECTNSSYLYFETTKLERFVFDVGRLPSQYIRKILAEAIGKEDWDWRASHRELELTATVSRLLPMIVGEAAV